MTHASDHSGRNLVAVVAACTASHVLPELFNICSIKSASCQGSAANARPRVPGTCCEQLCLGDFTPGLSFHDILHFLDRKTVLDQTLPGLSYCPQTRLHHSLHILIFALALVPFPIPQWRHCAAGCPLPVREARVSALRAHLISILVLNHPKHRLFHVLPGGCFFAFVCFPFIGWLQRERDRCPSGTRMPLRRACVLPAPHGSSALCKHCFLLCDAWPMIMRANYMSAPGEFISQQRQASHEAPKAMQICTSC